MLFVVTLLTGGECDGQAVGGRGNRAGAEGRVGAGRVGGFVEVENYISCCLEAV